MDTDRFEALAKTWTGSSSRAEIKSTCANFIQEMERRYKLESPPGTRLEYDTRIDKDGPRPQPPVHVDLNPSTICRRWGEPLAKQLCVKKGQSKKLLVVLAVATPPGSGKTTILKGVSTIIRAPCVSSDDFVGVDGRPSREKFEDVFLQHCTTPYNLSNVEGYRVVVYDKNVPDKDGLKALRRVVKPLFEIFDEVRTVQFCPKQLGEHEVGVMMERMRARKPDPKRIVLSHRSPEFDRIMHDVFIPKCRRHLEEFQCLRGTLTVENLFVPGAQDSIVEQFYGFIMSGSGSWYSIHCKASCA